MARLAIKGHATRGREVIELLKMLGGFNSYTYEGCERNSIFTISNYSSIIKVFPSTDYAIFTLEEFLEKFPYKVGDKVNAPCKGCIKTITSMEWDTYRNTVTYKLDNRIYTNIDQLKVVNDYKEETMVEKIEAFEILESHCKDEVMDNDMQGYKWEILIRLQEIIIARDAYWKIAGEEMGLGKSWEPDWSSCEDKFCITIFKNKQTFDDSQYISRILAFPTEEMRAAFYENFKDLIEKCKELL